MGRSHPDGAYESVKVFDHLYNQRGIIVEWKGPHGDSAILSPESELAFMPPFRAAPGPDGSYANGMHLDYSELLVGCTSNPLTTSVSSPELACLGASVLYTAVFNIEGYWVATGIVFLGKRFDLHESTMFPPVLQIRLVAVVNRIDPHGVGGRIYMWNDELGRIVLKQTEAVNLVPFDVVKCTVVYSPRVWTYGREEICWKAVAIERYYENSLPPVREVNKVASSIMTCDGWKVSGVRSYQTMLVHSNGAIAYAYGNDMNIPDESPPLNAICRVSYVKQIGYGRAFYRAILVSPLDVATGEPIDHHPLAVPVAE